MSYICHKFSSLSGTFCCTFEPNLIVNKLYPPTTPTLHYTNSSNIAIIDGFRHPIWLYNRNVTSLASPFLILKVCVTLILIIENYWSANDVTEKKRASEIQKPLKFCLSLSRLKLKIFFFKTKLQNIESKVWSISIKLIEKFIKLNFFLKPWHRVLALCWLLKALGLIHWKMLINFHWNGFRKPEDDLSWFVYVNLNTHAHIHTHMYRHALRYIHGGTWQS